MIDQMFFKYTITYADDPESDTADYGLTWEQLLERFPWVKQFWPAEDYLHIEVVSGLTQLVIKSV